MKLKTPIIIVNFKAYKESTGKKALLLAQKIEKAAKKHRANVAIAVQPTDILLVSSHVKIPVLAQHIDIQGQGAATGKVTIEAIKLAGAVGTLINHSEYNVPSSHVGEVVRLCKKHKMTSVVCAPTSNMAAKLAHFKPDFIAVEPPELIGGSVSVTSANPKIISDTVKKVYSHARVNILCGAGVNKSEDVKTSLMLGTKGVLLASGVVKNKNPFGEMEDLIKGLKS